MNIEQSPEQPRIDEGKPQFPLLVKSGARFLFEVVKIVIIALAIIIPVRLYLFQPFYVKGASMEPAFYDNEYLIINEIDYRLREPKRGDVVVLKYPKDPSQFFIKRIIGLPGETIEFHDGKVIIANAEHPDGAELDESAYLDPSVHTSGGAPVTLADGQYFVMGDNRPSSLDSRSSILGPVTRSSLIGHAWFRVWPVTRMNAFRAPPYLFQTLP